jgi:hypothetical protein
MDASLRNFAATIPRVSTSSLPPVTPETLLNRVRPNPDLYTSAELAAWHDALTTAFVSDDSFGKRVIQGVLNGHHGPVVIGKVPTRTEVPSGPYPSGSVSVEWNEWVAHPSGKLTVRVLKIRNRFFRGGELVCVEERPLVRTPSALGALMSFHAAGKSTWA